MLTNVAHEGQACKNAILHSQYEVLGSDRQFNVNFKVGIKQLHKKTKKNVPAQWYYFKVFNL